MPNEFVPRLEHVSDLYSINEIWNNETNRFAFTAFYIFDDDYRAFWGALYKRRRDISLGEYQAALERVPDEYIYPEIPDESQPDADFTYLVRPHAQASKGIISEARSRLTVPSFNVSEVEEAGNVTIIRPDLTKFRPYQTNHSTRDAFFREAMVMVTIDSAGHENIASCYGIVIRRNRIVGIVRDHPQYSLVDWLKFRQTLEVDDFMDRLFSAVYHLHDTFNFAHNSINPKTVMVTADGKPNLTDFRTCTAYGYQFGNRWIPGWTFGAITHSNKENDVFGLGQLYYWLKTWEFDSNVVNDPQIAHIS